MKNGRRPGLGNFVRGDGTTSSSFLRDPELVEQVQCLKQDLGENTTKSGALKLKHAATEDALT